MSKSVNNGRGFLGEKLGEYRVDPPEKIWESITSRLGNRRRRNLVIVTISAAASLALAVTLGIQFLGPEQEVASLQQQAEPMERGERVESKAVPSEAGPSEVSPSEVSPLEEKVVQALRDITDQEPDAVLAVRDPGQSVPDVPMAEEQAPLSETGDVAITGTEQMDELPVEQGGTEDESREEGPEKVVQETDEEVLPDLREEQQRVTRWNIDAVLSPLYSFRDAESSALSGAGDFESGMLAYAGGIQVGFQAGSRLAIESGLFYNKMGISIGEGGTQIFNRSLDFSPLGQEASQSSIKTITNSVGNIVAASGEVYVNNYLVNAGGSADYMAANSFVDLSVSDDVIRQHLEYLELPLNVRYTLVDRSFEIQLVGGMSTNFLVNNYVTLETPEGVSEIGYLANIRHVNYSGNLGVGMIFHLYDRMSLRLEPRFRYFLNSINDSTLPSTRPYTMGLYTGLSFLF